MDSQLPNRTIAVIFLFAMCAVAGALTIYLQKNWVSGSLPVGSRIHSFAGVTVNGVSFIRDSTSRKKLVLLFFAPGCIHCRAEIANLEKVYQQYHDRLDIAGISLDNAEATKSVMKELKIDFPVIAEHGRELGEMFGVQTLPSLLCIDESQVLRNRYTGEHSLAMLEHFAAEFASSSGRP
jgi:peroxiredoxin